MSAPAPSARGGRDATAAESAAVAAAIAAVLDEEARAALPDPVPAAYRSPWREAAVREGLRMALPMPGRR